MLVPELEKAIGIEVYTTHSLGVGGVIRRSVEDFVVEEVLVDDSKAEINPARGTVTLGALGSSDVKNRYLLCVLVKRNWDTLSAVRVLADRLGISMGRIQTGGLKDAKAATAQHITIEGISPEEAQKVEIKDIELRPVGYFRSKLSSYYLLGNNFHVTISSINHSKATIKKRIMCIIEELESTGGIPNFFGHQRFGTIRPITHLVGKEIVKKDFRKAVMTFLAKPNPHEHPSSREARETLQETHDWRQALNDFPRQLRYERVMLGHLIEKPEDYVGAIRRLPIKLQELFIQAYQSYLFNKFLSKRIENGARLDRAEIGDYVVGVERSGLPLIVMHKVVDAENLVEVSKAIQTGKMRLAIPLIGFRQHLSRGVQGEIEKQILEEEDEAPEGFKIKDLPEIAGRGELRTALTPLNHFLLDEIPSDSTNPSRNKVTVSFMLLRGSYATIVLRELMKTRNPVRAGF